MKFGYIEWLHRNTLYLNKQNQEKQNADTYNILVFTMKHHISKIWTIIYLTFKAIFVSYIFVAWLWNGYHGFFRHTNIEFQHGITQYYNYTIYKKCNGTAKTFYNINKRLQCVKCNFSKSLSKSISLFSDSSLNCWEKSYQNPLKHLTTIFWYIPTGWLQSKHLLP